MLPRADLNATRPVAYVEAPAPVGSVSDARQEVYHRLNQITLGQQVQAKVLDRQADGSFLVRLSDTTARMSLPEGTKAGDTLAMTLVARQPRPTFLLGQDAAAAGGARTTLSPAARLIDQLLQSSQQNGTSTAALGRVPVLPSPAASPAQLAAALQGTLDGSGLFYESHLAEWAEGSRSLAALQQEPQAQHGAGLAGKTENGQADAALLRHLARQWADSGRPITELADELQARAGNAQALPGLLADADLAAQQTAQISQILNAQLNTLETQRFVWQGELWPGQKLEWEVSRDTPDGKRQQGQVEQEAWQSSVKFELPHLGQVSATIHLTGERVRIMLHADSADNAALLRAHGGDLALALDAAGSPLDALTIDNDNQA